MGARAVGQDRAKDDPEMLSLVRSRRHGIVPMHLIGWAYIISAVHDEWTLAAFILFLICHHVRHLK
jgi:hypothetical protein